MAVWMNAVCVGRGAQDIMHSVGAVQGKKE